jgi:hypothetical protein
VTGDACPCGKRPSSKLHRAENPYGLVTDRGIASCTCEKASAVDAAAEAIEIDFTTRA